MPPFLVKSLPVVFILLFLGSFFHRYSRLYEQDWINSPDLSTTKNESSVSDSPSSLLIPTRLTLNELTELLFREELISDTVTFKWISKTHGWKFFQKGYYTFSKKDTISESLRRMGLGLQDTIPVTILPGQTKASISGSLARQLEADSLTFVELFNTTYALSENSLQYDFSTMLPETYFFFWNTSPQKVIERVSASFYDVIYELRRVADPSIRHLSDVELIILASIIEWEARYDDEKPRISGLYHNRLKKRMKLQADPTVNFALGERRRLLFRDYQLQHPYNTYVINGLPPGPITNPSYSSLKAAYQPESHDYLFMVATPEGRHEFNESYEDHLVAAEKWQNWIREQVRIRRQMDREALESQE